MNKNFLFSALIIGSGLFWQSCGSQDESSKQQPGAQQGQSAVPVSTTVVEKQIVAGTKSYPGSVIPLQETKIFAEVSGYVTKINVADGASVSKGQVLYEIDKIRYQAAVDQAKAALEIAKSTLQRGEKDLTRYETLAEKDAIAKQTLDNALTDVSNQKAQVQSAQAALTTAQTNLQRAVIRAPFSGVVGISLVRMGALVSAGMTEINTISTVDPITVEFQVSEREIAEFSAYQTGKSATEISAVLPDGTTYANPGRISTIDRAVDPQTGTIKVRATFSNAQNTLRAGMNLTVNVKSTSKSEQNIIPFKAVQDQLGVYNVFVVNDSSQAEIRPVKLGLKVGEQVVVESGVEAGEKIIVDGLMNVKSGARVVENTQAADNASKK
ncbi:efflux RND transporter periplasmic adaptor subunit [Sphingobacterium griseoflavum]|uniref:MexE family multidrug efflux RND transporter periplasmic adaptor subunit n=1 Tax=Sphingobacterium griseoflavum TaxID=1474952 RepID=A0ABQ3HUQ9_9SPHI|nr:efflux RND transporter periplasmic adaptor subunit [Sphingobacterium griseoflavum]GHE23217.1 MexE family multidrug efflux RND transporter periplasmic adaptor subunit [Sphingobacterium griseoflavum]